MRPAWMRKAVAGMRKRQEAVSRGPAKPRAPRRRKKRERSVEDPCVRIARAAGWLVRKMNGFGFNSWPDRLFIPPPVTLKTLGVYENRRTFWVEFKRPGEEPTEDQGRMIKDLVARGESAHVCDSVEGFRAIFAEYDR